MKNGMKLTVKRACTMISALMLFAVLGVTAPAAVLDPVPASLHFETSCGDTNAIPPQTFALIVPADVSATEYLLTATNSWIVSVENSDGDVSGTVPSGGTNTITVTVGATSELPVGEYYGKITVGTNWADVEVHLCVHMRSMAVVADFDGDGKADPTVYNTNGNWKIKLSSANWNVVVSLDSFLGGSGFTALAGDFDGDGLADPAVYHAELKLWEVKLSSAHYLVPVNIFSFGGTGWEALAGDFDGDGLADPAIYQASTGTWKMMLSSARYLTITKAGMLGWAGWQAIASDIDGDGKVDPAIYQASNANWIVLLSRANYALATLDPDYLGGVGYTAMAYDFDGDGFADPTVANTTTGHWQVKLSSINYDMVDLPGFLAE